MGWREGGSERKGEELGRGGREGGSEGRVKYLAHLSRSK